MASSCCRLGSRVRDGVAALIGPGLRFTCAVAREIVWASEDISVLVEPRRVIFLSLRL